MKQLKEAGANVNWKHTQKPPGFKNQFTPLHIAGQNGHTEIVKWLVEHAKVDMNAKCDYGETAYQHVESHPTDDNQAVKSYLKMKTAMNAVLAAQKFKAAAAKK